jgi:hypothetical protein
MPVLESLDSIDWASLDLGDDSATEMPHLLRSLLSGVREQREWAMDELSEAVIHQGTVNEASPLVVPFLFELLEGEQVRDKEQIVALLASMAGCCVYEEPDANFRRTLDADLRKEHGISYEESLDRQRALVRAVKSEIAKRFDLLYPYLRYRRDMFVRLAMATALAEFPEIVQRSRPDLEAALRSEPDEPVRTAISAALARP